jgi:hypothetical protein
MLLHDFLRILMVVVSLLVLITALIFFNRHCEQKFHFRFYTLKLFGQWAASAGFFLVGIILLTKHAEQWVAPAWCLIAVGAVMLWWIVSQNIIRTNLVYGAIGTITQIVLVCVFGSAGAFLGLMAGGVLFVLMSMVAPVYVINRRNNRSL